MHVDVRVNVSDYEKLVKLMRVVLVEEFDSKTGIKIEDDKLYLKLHFDKEPPSQSVYALTDCGTVTYLEYNFPPENSDDSAEPLSEGEEEAEVEATDGGENANEGSGNTPEGKKRTNVPSKPAPTKTTGKVLDIPELHSISSGVSSVDDYLTKVADFLGIPKEKCDTFISLVKIYPQIEKPTWKNIFAALKEQNIKCNTYDKKLMIDAVSDKLGLPFLKVVSVICRAMGQLDFSANAGNNEAASATPTDTAGAAEGEPEGGEGAANAANKLFPCMPDVAGEEKNEQLLRLELALSSIDKSLPMEERIRAAVKILSEKGLNGTCTDDADRLEKFIIFTQRAMSGEDVTFAPEVVNPEGVAENVIRVHILNWSKITKNIAKMYDPDTTEDIKAIEFLADLRKVLL